MRKERKSKVVLCMAGPDLPFLETLNNVLPYVGMAVVAIVASVIFVWYTKKYTPEIARTFIKAYHSRGLPVFIQDEMGNVKFHICDKKFPEGVVHVKGKGWFLLPNPPAPPVIEANSVEITDVSEGKRGRGRPPKVDASVQGDSRAVYGPGHPPMSRKQLSEMNEEELRSYALAYGILVNVPILQGFGKQVFFGSSTSVALNSLCGIAHADLLSVRKLAPTMYQKTQLDALATGSRLEGLKMGNKDVQKLLLYAIVAAVPIAAIGFIVYLLTQQPAALTLLAV